MNKEFILGLVILFLIGGGAIFLVGWFFRLVSGVFSGKPLGCGAAAGGIVFVAVGLLLFILHLGNQVREGKLDPSQFGRISPINEKKIDDYEGILSDILKRDFAPETVDSKSVEALSPGQMIDAVQSENTGLVKRLLEQGADVNARTSAGMTILMEAAALGYEEIVRILLAYGANRELLNPEGKNAAQVAEENYRPGIAELLHDHKTMIRKVDLTGEVPEPEISGIPIHPMINLNSLKKDEILSRRKLLAEQFPLLLYRPYEPSPDVFNRMKDGLPWIGFDLHYYGPGPKAVGGLSEESRFILNPFLLAGLTERIIMDRPVHEGWPVEPLEARDLTWSQDRLWAAVTYPVAGYWEGEIKHGAARPDELTVELHLSNARDYGFRYYFIDIEKSIHVQLRIKNRGVRKIRDRFHVNALCGHPSQCNTSRIYDPRDLWLLVSKRPAAIVVKLWQNKPVAAKDLPDMLYVIKLE